MEPGTLITGRDRLYERSIYVVERYEPARRVGEVSIAWCWVVYYDRKFFYRNDKPNKHLVPCRLCDYRTMQYEDYPPEIHINVVSILGTGEHYRRIYSENRRRVQFLDIDETLLNYSATTSR